MWLPLSSFFFSLTHYTCPFNLCCYCFCMPRITHLHTPSPAFSLFLSRSLANNIHLFHFPGSLFILSHVFIGGWLAWKEARQLDWFDIGMFRSSPAACACSMWVAETAVLLTHILCKYKGLAMRRGGVAGESTCSRGGAHRDCFCYRCALVLASFLSYFLRLPQSICCGVCGRSFQNLAFGSTVSTLQ